MKDIDPDVAALLDDLPKITLPQPLVDEGWGKWGVDDYGPGRQKKPSEVQAPNYIEKCCQCGRPITDARKGGGWWDHAGKSECDGAIVAERIYPEHFPQRQLDEIKVYVADQDTYLQRLLRQEAEELKILAAKQKAIKEGPCGANKHGHSCPHQCDQKGQHFGFHCCKFCRYLWK